MAKLQSEWRNRTEQDGMVMIDLHIRDLDNDITEIKMMKCYEADVVTDKFLNDEAELEMKKVIREFKLEELKLAKLGSLTDEDKDRILLKWARSLPEDQRIKILLDGMI